MTGDFITTLTGDGVGRYTHGRKPKSSWTIITMEKNSKGPNVGPHYILRSGNRKYDLGKSLLNNKPSGKRQLEALRQIDRLAQKHGVPIKVRRSMGTEMEQIMRNDPDMDDEEVDFLMQLFAP